MKIKEIEIFVGVFLVGLFMFGLVSGAGYSINVPSSSSSSSSSSGGSSGGGGNITSAWVNTFVVNDDSFKQGYARDLAVKERMKVIINNEAHYVGVKEITGATTVKIEVSSDPVEATLSIGDTRRFDVTGDGYYDVAVTLNSILDSNANIKILSIYEEVTEETIAEETEKEETAKEIEAGEKKDEKSRVWIWILIGLVVVLVIGFIVWKKKE